MTVRVQPLTAAGHRRHALHDAGLTWMEKNCYVDLWIELLHAQGLDAHAMLAFVFGIDFEGDQWTFAKPPLDDLRGLYGLQVQELTVWRPLLDHAVEHLAAGKWLSVEVDAFWLPDTAGTDYRSAHSKTTIVLNEVDVGAERLGYFHNAGYFELAGEDFRGVFAGPGHAPAVLPPYAELIRIDRIVRREGAGLRDASRRLFTAHHRWRPASNPFPRFGQRLETDLPALRDAGLAEFHRWAFAGLRQAGAAFELAALYLRWLEPGGDRATAAAAAFERVSQQAKALLLKAARSVNSGRPLDARPLVEDMAEAWQRGMDLSDLG